MYISSYGLIIIFTSRFEGSPMPRRSDAIIV
jgi:hypothetical protein